MNERDSIAPSEPQSRTQQSAVDSSLRPLSPSPSSLHHHPLRSMNLSPPLLRGSSSSAHVDLHRLLRECFSNFLELPLSPGVVSSTSSADGDYQNTLDLKDEYTADELKKISKCTKLTEMKSDPKKVRGILANREAAAHSKKRKSQYLLDLEHQVNFLEKDITLMQEKEMLLEISKCTKLTEMKSDPKKVRGILANREAAAHSKKRKSQYLLDLEHQVNFLEKDITLMQEKEMLLENAKIMLIDEEKEFMIRLESLEQQAKLHDEIKSPKATTTLNEQLSVEAQRLKEVLASNEQLSVEVQRLKMAIGDVMHNYGYQIDPNILRQLTINESDQSQTNKQH
ncbi:PREDICTED: basic leucine zipper 61-like [Camelina sativa]|uniref:Basic leucine zipper 61-like n=1 Tax=Camelina sativa TaxID=90675 RepID=A0ABM0XS65_CAMSA|nr:PREDICTED: basic leucine zipper 61-like [Camelina sativa]